MNEEPGTLKIVNTGLAAIKVKIVNFCTTFCHSFMLLVTDLNLHPFFR
jgi:hypothetical protein